MTQVHNIPIVGLFQFSPVSVGRYAVAEKQLDIGETIFIDKAWTSFKKYNVRHENCYNYVITFSRLDESEICEECLAGLGGHKIEAPVTEGKVTGEVVFHRNYFIPFF